MGPAVAAPYALLQPHRIVAGVLEAVVSALRGASGTRSLVGVHMRALEGSCKDRAVKFSGGSAEVQDAIEQQCAMSASYVKKFFSRGATSSVFIADDGQRGSSADALAKELGAVRTATLYSPTPQHDESLSLARQAIERATSQSCRQASKSNPRHTCDSSTIFSLDPPLFFLQMDYWLLSDAADVFVGTQMSTLSANVCRRRLSRGAKCDNFARSQITQNPL